MTTQAQVEFKGVDGEPAFPFQDSQLAPPGPPMRDLAIRIPASVPDEAVQMAMEIGNAVLAAIGSGQAVIMFPNATRDAQGQVQQSIGQFRVLLHKLSDVQKLQQLGNTINQVNSRIREAQTPSDELSLKVSGEKAKDNALRQLSAQAQGRRSGIVRV